MHSILPSINGAALIQTILAEADAGAVIQVFSTEWVTVAVELCSGCPDSHGVQAELARWASLVELRDSLSALLAEVETKQKLVSESLSSRDRDNLGVFGLGTPTGIDHLQGLLTSLREREPIFFRTFVNTFPCAVCLRRDIATGGVPVPPKRAKKNTEFAQSRKPLSRDALPHSFTKVLFGDRLGHWKICLSEHAFKDLLSANKEGNLKVIARRIEELATGQWEPNSLRLPLSQKMLEECRATMRIPLWRATYGRDGRILWQVNVGYDAEVDDERDYQIITVWRIGKVDEIRDFISQVLLVQKTYTDKHVERCCVKLQQFPVLPKKYLHQSSLDRPTPSYVDEAEHAAKGRLIRNKFYSLTRKVLDCLYFAPDTIAFPFELSREELEIVELKNAAAFILGRSGTGKTTCLLFKLLWKSIVSRENESPVRQIFLTRSSVLAERLKDYLRRLIESQLGNPSAGTGLQHQETQGYLLKETKDPLRDETLDTLQDDKFPLVCTFEQLFGFLEKAIKLNDRKNFSSPMVCKTPWEKIDYNVFCKRYWGKRYQDCRKYGLEPDLVFPEILGIIKGSTSLKRDFKPLSRQEYLRQTEEKAPVFARDDLRDRVYNLYENYEKKKRNYWDRDDIDRAIHILKSLEDKSELKEQVQTLFDEVYVDEVQDNKLLEIDLLFTLVKNPHGIHFAGDTAQCVSGDNTFRFADIKDRFYNHFSTMTKGSWDFRPSSKEFKLAKNYRSHQEILSLAADIVKMLCNGFPDQMDILPREIGEESGVKPTIFLGFDYKILPQGKTEVPGVKQAISDFGAEQVIIVKDDFAKEELKKKFTSTILTVYQSKGLEFEDVVLYNFFSNPMWDNIHLLILKLLLTRDAAGKLDKRRYGGLCSELKLLYVAITRARKNLWIVQTNRSSVQGLVELWTIKDPTQGREPLVSIIDIEEPEANEKARTIIQRAKSTTPEAWRAQGEAFLQRALYEDALVSFCKANYKQGEDLAQAYILYQEATLLDVRSSEGSAQAKEIFAKAARLFEQASFIKKAAETWVAAGGYKEAAAVLKADTEYDQAAFWYTKASDFREAAECHHLAKKYDEAVGAYHKGVHFTELVAYFGKYRKYISISIKTRYSRLINLLFQHGDLPETLLPAALEAFGRENEIEDFYKKFERTEDLMAFYRERKRYSDFHKVALGEGKFEDALLMAQESRAVGAAQAECTSTIPTEDLLSLSNGLMAGYTWSSTQVDFHDVSLARVSSPRKVWLAPLKQLNHPIAMLGDGIGLELHGLNLGWEEIFNCLWCANDRDLKIPRQRHNAKFFQELGNDFLDLVEFLRLDMFRDRIPQTTKVDQLPVATMQKYATIAEDLLSKKVPLPAGLIASIGGIMFSHLEDQIMILHWSPLFPSESAKNTSTGHQQNCSHAILKREQAYHSLTEWLITIAARIIPYALLQMHSLLVETRRLCFLGLQGSCPNPNNSCCKSCRHTRLGPKELRTEIATLLDAVELSCTSAQLYQGRKLNTPESDLHVANRHSLLECLLKELTFLSPLLNDSEIQKEIWQVILARNGKWSHVRDGLASFIFHPLQSVGLGTVSTLLEKSSVANQLGEMPQFLESLWHYGQDRHEERWKFDFIKSCNELNPTQIAHYDTSTLVNRIGYIIEFISRQQYRELQSFHSVLSLYESLSLELINRTHLVELLVPRSRLHFIRDLTQTPYPSDDDRNKLECCLVQLLGSLCDILKPFSTIYYRHRTESDRAETDRAETDRAETNYGTQNSNPDTLFEVYGKVLWDGDRYMVRRSLDHLTLCMINMGVGRTTCLPAGYNDLGKKIEGAYQHWNFLNPPASVNWSDSCNPNEIAIQLADVYRTYNNDKLVIVKAPQNTGSSPYCFLADRHLYPMVLAELLPTTKMSEYSDEALAAAKIVRWWRRCSTSLEARRICARKREYTPERQAEGLIDDILVAWIRSKDRRGGNIYILRDSGLLLLTSLLKLQRLIKMTHSTAMNRLTDSTEHFKLRHRYIIARLERRKNSLAKYEAKFRNTKGVGALFELPTNRLQERIDKDLEALETYRKEVEEWAREMEDCTWNESYAWTVWARSGFAGFM
ncbi:hypothetical protein EV426DRAFT_624835 [Tirmania nivea]|nr:hypothetical protein EV426DRAFT_624835 [Tirmania nivea]